MFGCVTGCFHASSPEPTRQNRSRIIGGGEKNRCADEAGKSSEGPRSHQREPERILSTPVQWHGYCVHKPYSPGRDARDTRRSREWVVGSASSKRRFPRHANR